MKTRLGGLGAAVLFALAACGRDGVTDRVVSVASVRVTAPADSLLIGQQLQLSATALDEAGASVPGPGRVLTWSSSSDAVATVSASGAVSGVGAGDVTITAQAGGKSGSVALRVRPVPVASVMVEPDAEISAQLGTPVQLTAVARDAAGNALTGRTVEWSTSDAARVQVSASGLATPVSTGVATVTATVEGKSASTRITVTPAPVASVILVPDSADLFPGGQLQLALSARDAAGNALAGRVVELSTSDPNVAVLDANRVVTAVGEGRAVITADVEGIVAQAVIRVRPAPIATLALEPDSADLYPGGRLRLALVARDGAGNVLAGRAATLATDNAAVATVDGDRNVTAVGLGRARITATAEGKVAEAVIRVRPVPIASLAIVPDSADVFLGRPELQLRVVARDSAGGMLAGRAAALTSSDPSIARVDEQGFLVPQRVGRVVVTAAAEGRTAQAVFHVRNVPVASLQITPDSSEIYVGGQVPLDVLARDAEGTPLSRDVTLTTSSAAVAAFSSPRVVAGLAPGTATITATSEGVTATAKVVVRLEPVARVVVSPAEPVMFAGSTQQFTAIVMNVVGTPIAGWPVEWSSSAPGVAIVSASGAVTAVSGGTARIRATVGGRTGEVDLTVRIPGQDLTNPEITFFDVDPSAIDVTSGQGTFTFTFRARDFGSGVSGVFVSLNYPGNPGYVPGCPGVRVEGNAYEGTYVCTINFPQNAPSHTWTVDYLSAADVVGNTLQLSNAQVAARGWPSQVTVTGSAPDTEAPTLQGFTLSPATVNVEDGPGSVTFTMQARDVGTGISQAYVSLNFPGNPGATMPCAASEPASGTRAEGVFQCTVTFPQNAINRTWDVSYVSLTDQVGNSRQIDRAELVSRGWPSQVTVSGGTPDTQAPILTGFSFTPSTVNVSGGPASVTFTISAEDAGGITGAFVSLSFPGNTGASNPCGSSDPVSGTRTSGVWRCTVTFPQGSPSRTWNVDYISLTDRSDNTYRPFQAELDDLGLPTTVQVTN